MKIGSHIEDEDIERYSLGALKDGESASLEEHLLICQSCRESLQESDAYVSHMYRASTELRSASLKPSKWWRHAAALAAAAMILIAVFLSRSPANTIVQEVRLYAMRGASLSAKVSAGRPLLLTPDLTGLPDYSSYHLQVVNAAGKPVFTGTVELRGKGIKMNGVRAGMYYVRLSSPAGELLREYGLLSEP